MREERKKEKGNLSRFGSSEPVIFQAGDWRIKRGWIGTKVGELVPHLEYFDLLSWFEDWLSRALDFRVVLSVQVTTVLEKSSFGR